MDERFKPAFTSPEVPPGSNLTALRDDSEGLTVVLTAPDVDETTYQVRFPKRLAVRITDEGDRLRSMDYLHGRAATPIGTVEDSSWVQWFIAETLDIRKMDPLTHWCIVTPNDIIDVIAMEPPDIETFPKGAQVRGEEGNADGSSRC